MSLYDDPNLYRQTFPLSREAVEFFASFCTGKRTPWLDAGAGAGDLAGALAERVAGNVIALDRETALLPRRRGAIAGNLLAIPFRGGAFGVVVSQHFPLAYAAAEEAIAGRDPLAPWREAARVLRLGGLLLAEVPLAHRPRCLQGVEERAPLGDGPRGGSYCFRYLMAYDDTPRGTPLDSEITAEIGAQSATLRAPLFVYTSNGIARLLAEVGLRLRGFCAPYDASTLTMSPPPDCRSAVVVAQAAGRVPFT